MLFLVSFKFYSFQLDIFLSSDPRIAHLPFTTTPWSLIAILSAYLYFVNDFGRNWMKNRKAFELKTIINIYNLAQVAVNSYLVVLVSTGNWKIKNWLSLFLGTDFDLCSEIERLQTFLHPRSPWRQLRGSSANTLRTLHLSRD